jgi:hypothetical protein
MKGVVPAGQGLQVRASSVSLKPVHPATHVGGDHVLPPEHTQRFGLLGSGLASGGQALQVPLRAMKPEQPRGRGRAGWGEEEAVKEGGRGGGEVGRWVVGGDSGSAGHGSCAWGWRRLCRRP